MNATRTIRSHETSVYIWKVLKLEAKLSARIAPKARITLPSRVIRIGQG